MEANTSGNTKVVSIRDRLGLVSDSELAELLGITIPTLKNRRLLPGGLPPSSKVGHQHVTKLADVERWLAGRKRLRAAR